MRASPLLLALALALGGSASAAGLSLTEALTRAVDHDPVVSIARARYEAESEAGEQERASLRPSLELKGTGSYSHTDAQFAFGSDSDRYPSWTAGLEARQPLLRMDWAARGDQADISDEVARENLEELQRNFVARVSQRYIDALLAEDRYDQVQSEVRAVLESLNDTRKRYEVELVPGTDLKEAQARYDLTQARLVAAAADLETSRDALQESTGYDRARLPTLREDGQFPVLDPPDLDGWLRIASENSGSLTAARLSLRRAQTDLARRKADALPTADLVASVGRQDSKEFALGARNSEAIIGVELSIPIYSGGINASQLREAQARLREAESTLQSQTLETERQVRTAFRAVETARAETLAYGRAQESAILAEAAAQAGYDAGTRTITDVLDAKSRVVQARSTRNAARYNLLIRLLSLNAVTGRLTAAQVGALDPLFVPR